jgi:hypothetical protein
MLTCRARLFHDDMYNWYWYCFDHGVVSLSFENVPIALRDLDNHKRDMLQSDSELDSNILE